MKYASVILRDWKPIPSALSHLAEACGFDRNDSVTHIVSKHFLLERMLREGSKRSEREIREMESELAPKFARYLAAICGGEFRHYGNASSSLSCGCHCWECHGENTQYRESRRKGEYRWFGCGESDPYEGGFSGECLGDLGPEAREFFDNMFDGEKPARETAALAILEQYRGGERLARVLRQIADAFETQWFEDSFGGEGWATIARVAAGYFEGKLKPRSFLNLAWSLEHNGGTCFNKMWEYVEVSAMRSILIWQASNKYNELVRYVDRDTARRWHNRRYHHLDLHEHNPTWMGLAAMTVLDPEEW